MNHVNNNISSSLLVESEELDNNPTTINSHNDQWLLINYTNINARQVSSDFTASDEANTSTVAENKKTNNSYEKEALIIDKSYLSEPSFISTETTQDTDISEYDIISDLERIEVSTVTDYNFYDYNLKKHMYEFMFKIYNLLANSFISTKINEFMLFSCNYLFKNSDFLVGLKEINILLDSFKNKEDISQEVIGKLCQLDKDNFYQILISQIHAKLFVINAENNFVKILYDISTYITNSTTNMTCVNDITALKKLIRYSLNVMIKKTVEHIINEENIELLVQGITTENQLIYEYTEINTQDLQDQFIKDAIRKPHINFNLLINNQEFWNTNSEDIQNLNFQAENIINQREKIEHGAKIFNLCYDQISKFLADFSCDNKDQLIKAILLELTQAGAAPASLIILSMQDSLNKVLCLPEDYLCKSILKHKRISSVKIESNQVIVDTSITFFPRIFIKNSSNVQINSQPINITTSLLLNKDNLAFSKYYNLKIKYVRQPKCR